MLSFSFCNKTSKMAACTDTLPPPSFPHLFVIAVLITGFQTQNVNLTIPYNPQNLLRTRLNSSDLSFSYVQLCHKKDFTAL